MLDFDSDEVRRRTGYNVAAGLEAQLAKRHSLGFTGRAIFNQNDNVLESTTGITLPGSTEPDQLLVSQTLIVRLRGDGAASFVHDRRALLCEYRLCQHHRCEDQQER